MIAVFLPEVSTWPMDAKDSDVFRAKHVEIPDDWIFEVVWDPAECVQWVCFGLHTHES